MKFVEKTLTEVMEILKHRGYTLDFNLLEITDDIPKKLADIDPSELKIEKVYRFYNKSDVDDESILYAMLHIPTGKKGVFVNGYGVTSDEASDAIIDQIITEEIDDSTWGI